MSNNESSTIHIVDDEVILKCGAEGKFSNGLTVLILGLAGCSGCYFYKDQDSSIHHISGDAHRVCPFFNKDGQLAPVGDQSYIDELKRRGIK